MQKNCVFVKKKIYNINLPCIQNYCGHLVHKIIFLRTLFYLLRLWPIPGFLGMKLLARIFTELCLNNLRRILLNLGKSSL